MIQANEEVKLLQEKIKELKHQMEINELSDKSINFTIKEINLLISGLSYLGK